jgi:hypothetical protein
VGDDSHFVFGQNLLGEDESGRRGVVMVKQPGLFSPKFGATSSHVFTPSPQNFAVERGIHSLASWDRCFALPQLLSRWRHQSGTFLILPRMLYMQKLIIFLTIIHVVGILCERSLLVFITNAGPT